MQLQEKTRAEYRRILITSLGREIRDTNYLDCIFDSWSFDEGIQVKGAIIEDCQLTGSTFREGARLTSCSFRRVDLSLVELYRSKLISCSFDQVDFSNTNLVAWKVQDCSFTNCRGLGTKQEEMEFASLFLNDLSKEPSLLDMEYWIGECSTTFCLAGYWCHTHNYDVARMVRIGAGDSVGRVASSHIPTLAQYFLEKDNKLVVGVLEEVAAGELSIWNE